MQELVDEYLTMLQVESGCAVNTLAAYRRDLKITTLQAKERIRRGTP